VPPIRWRSWSMNGIVLFAPWGEPGRASVKSEKSRTIASPGVYPTHPPIHTQHEPQPGANCRCWRRRA